MFVIKTTEKREIKQFTVTDINSTVLIIQSRIIEVNFVKRKVNVRTMFVSFCEKVVNYGTIYVLLFYNRALHRPNEKLLVGTCFVFLYVKINKLTGRIKGRKNII